MRPFILLSLLFCFCLACFFLVQFWSLPQDVLFLQKQHRDHQQQLRASFYRNRREEASLLNEGRMHQVVQHDWIPDLSWESLTSSERSIHEYEPILYEEAYSMSPELLTKEWNYDYTQDDPYFQFHPEQRVVEAEEKNPAAPLRPFNPLCQRYSFQLESFPTATLVFRDAATVTNQTLHKILVHSPPSLLSEIVLLDHHHLSGTESSLSFSHPKIKRMADLRQAKGEVLVLFDNGRVVVPQSSMWLQHLLLPILENPYTVSATETNVNNTMQRVAYESVISEEDDQRPLAIAVRKDIYKSLMGHTGGGNIRLSEIAVRNSLCYSPARTIMVPCSVFHEPEKSASQIAATPHRDSLEIRRMIRFQHVWFRLSSQRLLSFCESIQKSDHLAVNCPLLIQSVVAEEDIETKDQLRVQAALQCHNLDWYDQHVYTEVMGQHHPLFAIF